MESLLAIGYWLVACGERQVEDVRFSVSSSRRAVEDRRCIHF